MPLDEVAVRLRREEVVRNLGHLLRLAPGCLERGEFLLERAPLRLLVDGDLERETLLGQQVG